MNHRTILFFAAVLAMSTGTAMAQAGSLDMTFDPGDGADATIHSVVLQPDGRILIAGEFTSYNGTPRNHIARLNADGSLDTSFDPGTGPNDDTDYGDPLTAPFPIAVQADGKILIGGAFTTYNGLPRNRIARLNADGSLDTSFDTGSGTDGTVWDIVQQSDGRILIAGEFTTSNGIARNHIARLNADGSLEMNFDSGTWMTGGIHSLALQPDGRILIGGEFYNDQGSPPNNIARLNADGSLDGSYMGGWVPNIRSVVQQPDGNTLVGGGGTGAFLGRLNTDGGSDITFNPGSLLEGLDVGVFDVALQPDGKVLVGGHFHNWDTLPIAYPHFFARVNADGSLDTSFDTGTGPGSEVWEGMVNSIALQPDGRILIGGVFDSYDGIGRNHIARLMGDDVFDCEGILGGSALPGTACDDGNASTANDVLTEGCLCLGTPVDTDGDGIPDDTDCAPEDPTIQVLNAGTNGTCSVCGNNTAYNLFSCLGGGPQPGGTWKRLPSGTVVSASFDASAEVSDTYQFRYVIDATDNCPGDSAVANVLVTDAPDAGVDSTHILCANADPVVLFDLLGGSPDPTGFWTTSNGVLHNGFFVPGTDPPGGYGYQVEGQGPCAGDSAVVLIDLQAPVSIVPVTIPTSVLSGEQVTFTVEPAGAVWSWTPPEGWTYDDTTGSTFVGTVAGQQGETDSVCVQGTLAACVADSCFEVTIDGSVGIADTHGSGPISIYPNPGTELFTVASAVAEGPYHYEVLDALGRKLLDSGTRLAPFTLDLSFLATGTYTLRWHGDGRQGSVPLLKQ